MVRPVSALSQQVLRHLFVKLRWVTVRHLLTARAILGVADSLLRTGGLTQKGRVLTGQLVGREEVVGSHVGVDWAAGLGPSDRVLRVGA